MVCIKLYLFLLRVRPNLRLVWHLDAYLQGILKYYSGQFILDLCIMGLYLLTSRVYKWTIYMRLTSGLCTVYILSPGYPWDIVLSMWTFEFLWDLCSICKCMPENSVDSSHVYWYSLCWNPYWHLVQRLKMCRATILSLPSSSPSISATSCYMNRQQSPDNGCCKIPQ